MKIYLRQLLRISLAILCAYFIISLSRDVTIQNSAPQSRGVDPTSPGLPVKLVIPTLDIDATVQHVGIDSQGNMDVPNNIVDVGWFKLGSRPGEKGSAVISGHIDGNDGKAGVFNNLHKLQKGDTVYMYDDKGTKITFVVRESRMYDPGFAEDIFSANDTMHLNLITCDGVWDTTKKTYTKRLVVFTTVKN